VLGHVTETILTRARHSRPPVNTATEWPQTNTSDSAATEIGRQNITEYNLTLILSI